MVAMMNKGTGFAHAMVDHVGMGQALDSMLPIAEGEHRRGQNEAKRRDLARSTEPKARAPNEWDEH